MSCIKIMSFIKKNFEELEFLTFDNNIYSSDMCLEISNNTFHNFTLYDIKTVLLKTENMFLDKDKSKKYHGEYTWVCIVFKWLHQYFYGTILNLIEEKYDPDYYSHEICTNKHYSSKFSTVEFNILKFVKEPILNGLIFSMNKIFIKNTFGIYETIEFELLCKKSGVNIPSYDFCVLFK